MPINLRLPQKIMPVSQRTSRMHLVWSTQRTGPDSFLNYVNLSLSHRLSHLITTSTPKFSACLIVFSVPPFLSLATKAYKISTFSASFLFLA